MSGWLHIIKCFQCQAFGEVGNMLVEDEAKLDRELYSSQVEYLHTVF